VALPLSRLRGPVWLMAALMYGAGLRLLECAELRVKDLNVDRGELTIRDGKGGKDRVTMLPATLKGPLLDHLARVRVQHEADLMARRGSVALPGALRAKYPHAPRGVGLAVGLSRDAVLRGPGDRGATPPSPTRVGALHARPEPRRARRPEPTRPTRTGRRPPHVTADMLQRPQEYLRYRDRPIHPFPVTNFDGK